MLSSSSTGATPSLVPSSSAPSIPITLAILILALLFLGFFSIYFCRCIMKNAADSAMNDRRHSPRATATIMHAGHGTPVVSSSDPAEPPGLDPWIINSFPTFPYSSVMEYRRETYGLECAICICEFESDDMLRLLTTCSHVFHRHCVDLWLETQKSCPVCRCCLDTSAEKWPEKEPITEDYPTASTTADDDDNIDQGEETVGDGGSGPVQVEIVVVNKVEEEDGAAAASTSAVGRNGDDQEEERRMKGVFGVGRFSRSHSTGHSIGESTSPHDDEDDQQDKHTLRLPEDVKERLTRRHMQTLSCTTFGEMTWSRLSYENNEISETKGKADA